MRSLAFLLLLLVLAPGALAAAVDLEGVTVGKTHVATGVRAAVPSSDTRSVVTESLVRAERVATTVELTVADRVVADLAESALLPAPLRLATDPHGAKFARLERQAATAALPRALPAADAPALPRAAAVASSASTPSPWSASDLTPRAVSEPTTEAHQASALPRSGAATGAAGVSLGVALIAFALYHRLRGANVLDHGARARIAALLRAQPGLTPAQIARGVGVDPSTALYHLRRMVKEGVLVCEGERRASRYFAPGSVAPAERARLVTEREAAPVLEAIRQEPGVSKTRLAERLAIARATLSWHLARLDRAGLVRCERDGREVKVFPA